MKQLQLIQSLVYRINRAATDNKPVQTGMTLQGAGIVLRRVALACACASQLVCVAWAQAPFVNTHPPVFVDNTTAMLRGMVNPRGQATVAWFEWGTTTNLGNATSITNISGGSGVIWVGLQVSGIEPRQAYYCRLVASNSFGVVRGNLQMFGFGGFVVAWGGNVAGLTNVPVGLQEVVGLGAGGYHSMAVALMPPLPLLHLEPVGQGVMAGAVGTFSVTAIGEPSFGYQWFKDGVPLADTGRVAGANEPALQISAAEQSDAGSYWVVVRNAYGSATSRVATLLVHPRVVTGSWNSAESVGGQKLVQFNVAFAGTSLSTNGSALSNGAAIIVYLFRTNVPPGQVQGVIEFVHGDVQMRNGRFSY